MHYLLLSQHELETDYGIYIKAVVSSDCLGSAKNQKLVIYINIIATLALKRFSAELHL